MELFDRQQLIRDLIASTAPITLLIGDSGTGKTAVLERLQAEAPQVAPPPVRVGKAPGSLRVAVLDGLSGAVCLLTETQGLTVESLGKRLSEIVQRVSEKRLRDLAVGIVRHIMSGLRAQAGDGVADLIEDVGTAMLVPSNVSLQAQIDAANEREVLDQLVVFGAAVGAMAGERGVQLAIDDLDRLDSADLGRLADLAEILPRGLTIRGSCSTWSADTRQRIEILQGPGLTTISIGGLSPVGVASWLHSCGLDESFLPNVMAATNGYPAHVADAVALLRENPEESTLLSLKPSQVVRARTKQAWRELGASSQVAAARLCFYADPIPARRITSVLAVDETEWSAIEFQLVDTGIFTGSHQPWFHELRRRVIRDDLLRLEQREVAVDSVCREIGNELRLPSARPADFVAFANVAALNSGLQSGDAGLAQILAADVGEIGVAAAAVELIDLPEHQAAMDGDVLLAHARSAFPSIQDPLTSLQGLVGRGLIAVDEESGVVTRKLVSEASVHALLGRAARDLGRMPVSGIATAFGSVLQRQLGRIDMAVVGVGRPSMETAAEWVRHLHRLPRHGVGFLSCEEPGLVIQASHGDVPLYAAISFLKRVDRDVAVACLARMQEELSGQEVVVQEVLALPAVAVPSMRFRRSHEWLLGSGSAGYGLVPPQGWAPLTLARQVKTTLEVAQLVRDRASQPERYAYNLERSRGFAYASAGDQQLVVEIDNFDASVEVDPAWWREIQAPFGRFLFAEHLGLGPTQRITTVTRRHGRGPTDPVGEAIERFSTAASSFNGLQARREIGIDETNLARLFQESLERVEADGRALVEALPEIGFVAPEPRTTLVVLVVDHSLDQWVPGGRSNLVTTTVPRAQDEHCVLRILGGRESTRVGNLAPEEQIQHVFGGSRPDHWSISSAADGISRLLGHRSDEISVSW